MSKRWFALGSTAALSIVGGFALLRGATAADEPLSDRLPADTVFYLGFRDFPALADRLRRLPPGASDSWAPFAETVGLAPLLAVYSRHEADLRAQGPGGALVARRGPAGLSWAALFHAGTSERLFGSAGRKGDWHYLVDRGRVILASSAEEASAFRDAPTAPLPLPPESSAAVLHVIPAAFRSDLWSLWCLRWEDFSSITLHLDVDSEVRVRGMARYSPAAYRTLLEHYASAPPRAVAPPSAVAWTTQLEHAPRFWQDVLSSLTDDDRRLVEHELKILGREFRDPVREILPRLGPVWGAAISPRGELTGAVELGNTPELPDLLRRSIRDYAKAMRDRGRELLVDLVGGEPQFRTWRPVLRLGDRRLELGDPPPLWGPGRHHLGTVIDVPGLRKAFATPDGRAAATLFFDSTEAMERWTALLAWAGQAEAWTHYTGAGAEIDARLSFAPASP